MAPGSGESRQRCNRFRGHSATHGNRAKEVINDKTDAAKLIEMVRIYAGNMLAKLR
jgi:hypothetical protein